MEVEDNLHTEGTKDGPIDEPLSRNEKEAVEKLKNAEWSPTAQSKQNESYENQNYSIEGRRQRNIVHQKKGDMVHSGSNRHQRSNTQKNQKRNTQK